MFFANLNAKYVAGQIEPTDLAAPIYAHPVSLHRSTNNLVEVIGWLALTVYFRIAGEVLGHTQELDSPARSIGDDAGRALRV